MGCAMWDVGAMWDVRKKWEAPKLSFPRKRESILFL